MSTALSERDRGEGGKKKYEKHSSFFPFQIFHQKTILYYVIFVYTTDLQRERMVGYRSSTCIFVCAAQVMTCVSCV